MYDTIRYLKVTCWLVSVSTHKNAKLKAEGFWVKSIQINSVFSKSRSISLEFINKICSITINSYLLIHSNSKVITRKLFFKNQLLLCSWINQETKYWVSKQYMNYFYIVLSKIRRICPFIIFFCFYFVLSKKWFFDSWKLLTFGPFYIFLLLFWDFFGRFCDYLIKVYL